MPNVSDPSLFNLIMRPGVAPDRVVGKKIPPPPQYIELRENGLHIERNVSVRLRDGVQIFVDVYRPTDFRDALPLLLAWSPYGKHNLSSSLPWPEAGVLEGWLSSYTAFEAPDPLYWCRHGYAVVYPDPRGSWYSEGELRHGGVGEAEDCFDLIEWLGQQAWSNGKVGMSGVSYLAAIQWQVAPLSPPHLAAINPWEGFSDWYREFAYHGGIPESSFIVRGMNNLQYSTTRTEDTVANARAHPLYDAYWASKECALESIETPAYVVASWSDQGLHTRGTLEGFRRIGSSEKWLEVHGRKKWYYFYEPSRVEKQRQFFDHFLKQRGAIVPAWPKVLLETRERAYVGEFHAEDEWPIARTYYKPLYLDAATGNLCNEPLPVMNEIAYESCNGRALFDYRFAEDTELTGSMELRLWVEARGADDMDLFVALQKLDSDGSYVPFVFYAMNEDGPAALGWLRASHREVDPKRSTAGRPFHTHVHEQRLHEQERVALNIEIWPSSTLFRAGQRLRLIVQGRDIADYAGPNAPFARHENTRNHGTHMLLTGAQYDSHLLVPVIPRIPGRG